MQLQR